MENNRIEELLADFDEIVLLHVPCDGDYLIVREAVGLILGRLIEAE